MESAHAMLQLKSRQVNFYKNKIIQISDGYNRN
jgi:hypothetical protein